MRYFKSFLLLIFLVLSASRASSKDLGFHGQVWDIKEENIISYIKEQTSSQRVKEINKKFQKNVKKKVLRPDPVQGISNTVEKKVHFFSPEITLRRDIVDNTGKILHRKGTKVNPLDHQEFSRQLLFINGDDIKQVKYALSKHQQIGEDLKIVLINGSPIELMKDNNMVRFYFDQQGFLVKTFGIKTVPSLVKKEGKLMKIEAVVLGGKR